MTEIRQYILSVIVISFLCGLAQLFLNGSNLDSVVKLITGLMITITVVSPFTQDQDLSLNTYFERISAEGKWAVADGQEASMNAAAELIKEKTESYICDKAAEMGAVITVEVMLDENTPPVPSEVTVRGNVSPYIKKQLEYCLQKDLGINEDKQVWIS